MILVTESPPDLDPDKLDGDIVGQTNRLGEDSIDVHLVLPRLIESDRFRRIERLGKLDVHHARLSSRRDLDAEFKRWMKASYVEYGTRQWLVNGERGTISRADGSRRRASSRGRRA